MGAAGRSPCSACDAHTVDISRSIAYVELDSVELVMRALQLSGTKVMGLPVVIAPTESERNLQGPSNIPANLPGQPSIGCVLGLQPRSRSLVLIEPSRAAPARSRRWAEWARSSPASPRA